MISKSRSPRRDGGGDATSVATLVPPLVTGLAAIMIWTTCVTAPWTRDGRIRVQVASIAPQVSGQIVELRAVDNQLVRKACRRSRA